MGWAGNGEEFIAGYACVRLWTNASYVAYVAMEYIYIYLMTACLVESTLSSLILVLNQVTHTLDDM